MKKPYSLLLVWLCFLLVPAVSRAQSSGKRFSFGLKAGANFSKLNDLSYQTPRLDGNGLPVMSGGQVVYDFFQQNDTHTLGITGGLYARFGSKIYLQPEVLFSVKGGKFDIIRQGLATQSVNVKVGTIDVPVLLGVRLGPLRLNAGPMASLPVLSGNLKESLQHYTTQAFRETTKQAQFGYQAGIGLSLAGMQLDLRYEGGLGKPTISEANDLNKTSSTRSNLWQLTVGFGF
ncbi:porin family protein [Larkinella bovis]|uniref:Porin family protein n=1 Tax=Larkinella bovis TaxID=683041 RepID=A0ABW0IG29_9BACT